MSGLNEYDMEFHPDEDSYETPRALVDRMASNYGMKFELDVAANEQNKKCEHFLNNAMFQEWVIKHSISFSVVDVWCNPPHSMNEEFIKRANLEHKRKNMNIVMIIPANVTGTKTYQKLIENETECFVENHPLKGRPVFLKNDRKTKNPSRNSYRIIVWRKK